MGEIVGLSDLKTLKDKVFGVLKNWPLAVNAGIKLASKSGK